MKLKAFSAIIATTAILSVAGCSTHGTPKEYHTPSAPATSDSNAAGDPFATGDGLGSNPPGVQSSTGSSASAFGVDTSKVTIPSDVTAVWGDTAQSSVEDALQFIKVSSAIIPRWKNTTSSSDDYRAVQALMTPAAWTRLQKAADSGDTNGLASSLVPGRYPNDTLTTTDNTTVKLPVETPLVGVPQNVTVTLAQSKSQFGDTSARLAVTADVYSDFPEKTSGLVVKRNITLYLVSLGDGWKVDNWKQNSIERV